MGKLLLLPNPPWDMCPKIPSWCLNLEIPFLLPPGQLWWFCCRKMGQTWRVPFTISIHNLRLFTAGVYPTWPDQGIVFWSIPIRILYRIAWCLSTSLGTNLVSRFCNIIWSIYVIGKELSDLVQRIPSLQEETGWWNVVVHFDAKLYHALQIWMIPQNGLKINRGEFVALPFRKFTCKNRFLSNHQMQTACFGWPHPCNPICPSNAFPCRMAINKNSKITLS